MPHTRNAICVTILVVALPTFAHAQGKFPPDSFTNLKVLPKDIDQRALLNTMRGFTEALGVRCPYCHVGREGLPLDSFDFVSDQKRTKRTARIMLRMVQQINNRTLMQIPDRPSPTVAVRCATCHRGIARPRLLEDDLQLALADSGLDAAVRRYRELRQRYYGSGAYDFRENVLTQLAEGETRAGRAANAMGLLKLDADYYPASAAIASAHYRLALSRDSTFFPARRRLRALTGGGRQP
jgi:hypothetical protein